VFSRFLFSVIPVKTGIYLFLYLIKGLASSSPYFLKFPRPKQGRITP
jgi:hypothetical protein